MISAWLMRRLPWPTVRGVRGATTLACDTPEAMHRAVAELVDALRDRNALRDDEVVSALFTVTPDLVATFPAQAARLAGWGDVPLLCATEIGVPGALPRCLRILLHVQRHWTAAPVPVYLHGAAALRPDLAAVSDAPQGIRFRR